MFEKRKETTAKTFIELSAMICQCPIHPFSHVQTFITNSKQLIPLYFQYVSYTC